MCCQDHCHFRRCLVLAFQLWALLMVVARRLCGLRGPVTMMNGNDQQIIMDMGTARCACGQAARHIRLPSVAHACCPATAAAAAAAATRE